MSSGDTARVAKFVFSDDAQAQMTATLDLTGIKPGTSKDFVVSVTNQSGDQVCETSMRYHLEVRTKYGSLPLTFTVKNQQTSESKTASIVTTTASDIAAGAPTTHTYTITVAWPANEDAYEFANKIDIVTVTVVADQID